MSKAIVIQKNGVDQEVSVDRLSTPKVGGGRELWLPEDETTTGSVTATKNETINASDAGLYGFHEAVINVKSVTGKKDGVKYTVTVDDDGNLVYTPDSGAVRIAVTQLPNNTFYGVGAYLDFTGIQVTAYDSAGNSLGVVPFDELIFPVTTATVEGGSKEARYANVNALYNPNMPQPICYSKYVYYETMDGSTKKTETTLTANGNAIIVICFDPNPGATVYFHMYLSDTVGDTVTSTKNLYRLRNGEWEWIQSSNRDYELKSSYQTKNGLTQIRNIRFPNDGELSGYIGPERYRIPDASQNYYADVYQIIYSGVSSGGVPVQWARTGDGVILETSFPITVVHVGGGGSGGNDN